MKTFYAIVAQGLPTRPLELLCDNDNYVLGSPSTTHAQDSQYTKDISYDVSFEWDATSPFYYLEPIRLDMFCHYSFHGNFVASLNKAKWGRELS